MRVLYIAKHNSGGADDEGSIAHALTLLGHQVISLQEQTSRREVLRVKADLCLFHKYDEVDVLSRLQMPKVFWYFDLVDYPDKTLEPRNRTRRDWMSRVTPHVNLGFCSDGDWVAKDTTGKLHYLTQGVDIRVTWPGTSPQDSKPLLFTGIQRSAGLDRSYFVQAMKTRYGSMFHVIERGAYRRALADTIAGTKIVVAPSGPVTNKYCSNRVYNTLGFQGFLLHPYCTKLAEQYKDGEEIVFYQDHDDMFAKIDWYIFRSEDRRRIARAGYLRTMVTHTYVHRCAQLLSVIQETLGDPTNSSTGLLEGTP